MLFESITLLIFGLFIGLSIGEFSQVEPRSKQVYIWAMAGACIGAHLGGYGGVILISMLPFIKNGEPFSGLVPGIIVWVLGATLGATAIGYLGVSACREGTPSAKKLATFLIGIALVATIIIQATHTFEQYASRETKSQVNRFFEVLRPKARLLKTLRAESIGFGEAPHLVVSPDGQILASVSDDNTVALWNLKTGQVLRSLPGVPYKITSLTFSPDTQTLAVGSSADTIGVYDVRTGQQSRVIHDATANSSNAIVSLAISPNGQWLASSNQDGSVKVWNLTSGQLVRILSEPNADSIRYFVVFSPDGQTILGGSSRLIKVWQQQDGQLLRTLETLKFTSTQVTDISIGKDAQTLMMARSSDCTSARPSSSLEFWELRTGKLQQAIEVGCSLIPSAAISHDWQTVAAVDSNNVIQVWTLASGELVATFSGGTTRGVPSIAISPDGQTVFSADNEENVIKVWQLPKGQ